jgi:multicomponent Na+:H+ antiporter subunit G
MSDFIAAIFISAGSLFMLVAAIGVIRLPDVFMRMHAITKASSLSILLISAGLVLVMPTLRIFLGCFTLILFIFLTTPVASHMIARAAAMLKEPVADGCKTNEYDHSAEIEEEE